MARSPIAHVLHKFSQAPGTPIYSKPSHSHELSATNHKVIYIKTNNVTHSERMTSHHYHKFTVIEKTSNWQISLHAYDEMVSIRENWRTNEPCFFLLFTGYIFSSCLRVAYALPTPLRCFPTRGLFVLICLRVPTLTNCFLILPTRLACVASVGFLLVLILHILPTRWAPVLSVEVVFFVLLGIATPGFRTLPPTPPTQKKILTNILKMPTKSLRAQAKCLRQHFTRHTLYKLNLPTKKRCSNSAAIFHPCKPFCCNKIYPSTSENVADDMFNPLTWDNHAKSTSKMWMWTDCNRRDSSGHNDG